MSMEVREIKKFFLLLETILVSTHSTLNKNVTVFFEEALKKDQQSYPLSQAFSLRLKHIQAKQVTQAALHEKGVPFFPTAFQKAQLKHFDAYFAKEATSKSPLDKLPAEFLRTLTAHFLLETAPNTTVLDLFQKVKDRFAERWIAMQKKPIKEFGQTVLHLHWSTIGNAFLSLVRKAYTLRLVSQKQFESILPPVSMKRMKVHPMRFDPQFFNLFFPGLHDAYEISKRSFHAGTGFLRLPDAGDVMCDGNPAPNRFYTDHEKAILVCQYPDHASISASAMEGYSIFCATAEYPEPSIKQETYYKLLRCTQEALMVTRRVVEQGHTLAFDDFFQAEFEKEIYERYAYALKDRLADMQSLIQKAVPNSLQKKQYQMCYDYIAKGTYKTTASIDYRFREALAVTYAAFDSSPVKNLKAKIEKEACGESQYYINHNRLASNLRFKDECLAKHTAIFLTEYKAEDGWLRDKAERMRLENQLLDLSVFAIDRRVRKKVSFATVIDLMHHSCLHATWAAMLAFLLDIKRDTTFLGECDDQINFTYKKELAYLREHSRNRGFYDEKKAPYPFKPIMAHVQANKPEPVLIKPKAAVKPSAKGSHAAAAASSAAAAVAPASKPKPPMSPTFFYHQCLAARKAEGSETKLTRSQSAPIMSH